MFLFFCNSLLNSWVLLKGSFIHDWAFQSIETLKNLTINISTIKNESFISSIGKKTIRKKSPAYFKYNILKWIKSTLTFAMLNINYEQSIHFKNLWNRFICFKACLIIVTKLYLKTLRRKKIQQVFFEKVTENKESFYLKMKIRNEAIKSSDFLL